MEHTIPVKVMVQEEVAAIAEAEKAVFGSKNPKIYGSNGERIILEFLRKYVPSCFRFTTGHALRSDGKKSPEIDLMLVDSRFPPVSVHSDGTTLEMRESVLGVVSVKKQLNQKELREQETYSQRIFDFFAGRVSENERARKQSASLPVFYIIAYKSTMRERTVLTHLNTVRGLRNPRFTIFCLRMPKTDIGRGLGQGAIFRYDGIEPDISLMSVFSTAPLSDFYFMMLQDAYYQMDGRYPNYKSIGTLLMDYYRWGRVSAEVYDADIKKRRRRPASGD